MQRQAVPLLVPEAPIVGTGMEYKAAHDSGVGGALQAGRRGGEGGRRPQSWSKDTLRRAPHLQLSKFAVARSNQGTCINQRPRVKGRAGHRKGRPAGRRSLHEMGEIGLGPQRPHRLHDLGGLQTTPCSSAKSWSRRTCTPPSTSRSLSPSREPDGEHPTSQAGDGGRVNRTSNRTAMHRLGQGSTRPAIIRGRWRRNWRAGAQGRNRPHRRGAPASRHLRRKGPRGARHLPARAPRRGRHRGGREDLHPREQGRTLPRRQRDGARLHRPEAQDQRGRQDGRPPRQQGRGQPHPARGGYALHARRHPLADRFEPAGRAFPYEPGPGAGSAPGHGRQGPRLARGHPRL